VRVEIKNKNSYGGEMAIISDTPSSFWDIAVENGIKPRTNGEHIWFMVSDIALVANKRFAQHLIDLVEELGDYEIPFSVKHYATPREPVKGVSRFINKKSR
tara:strand:+ start:4249 stop:4551 length:303 start_codon:yes stop_codon:yes gene_type:complete